MLNTTTLAGATEEIETPEVAAKPAAPAEDYGAGLGSKSDSVAFITTLVDPSDEDVVYDENKVKSAMPRVVGFRFKALEAMTIPDCGTGDDLKNNPMSYLNAQGTRKVKKGEEFDLTRFELGMLASTPEFNARITGGDRPVVLSYATTGITKAKGDASAIADAYSRNKLPTVSLKLLDKGSMRDIQGIPVLDFEVLGTKTGFGGKVAYAEKKKTIRPGFEKWAPLCLEVASRTPRPSAGKKDDRNKSAAAFLSIVKKREAIKK